MALQTERLVLVPMTVEIVEAVMARNPARVEALTEAKLPEAWPGPDLVSRAFAFDIVAVRQDPERRLWGDRLLITRQGPPRIVGSVVFHGRPDDDGIAEVAYGVEPASQRLGLATEGTRACVEWALQQPGVVSVTATTMPFHQASLRVIQKLGMRRCGEREHPMFGELQVYEVRSIAELAPL